MAQRKRRWTCRDCGAARTPDNPISKTGRCVDCGDRAMRDALAQLASGVGPVADKRREGLRRVGLRL